MSSSVLIEKTRDDVWKLSESNEQEVFMTKTIETSNQRHSNETRRTDLLTSQQHSSRRPESFRKARGERQEERRRRKAINVAIGIINCRTATTRRQSESVFSARCLVSVCRFSATAATQQQQRRRRRPIDAARLVASNWQLVAPEDVLSARAG